MAGRKYGNMETQRLHDRNEAAAKKPASREKSEEEPAEEMDEQPMEDVVAEHGPAQEMEVTSTHEDGHKHKSKHHDAKSASDHVHKAFGEAMPEEHAGDSMAEEGAPAIPTMA